MTTEPQETAEGTEIITIPHKADVPALFAKKGGIAGLIAAIEKQALSVVIDVSTPVGRKDAKSLAAKVSRSKTLIDECGKEENADRLLKNKAVNELRTLATTRLDELRDKIKAPGLAWEKLETDRVIFHETAMDIFALNRSNAIYAAGTIQSLIDEVDARVVDETWEEYEADARTAKALALDKYRMDLGTAQAREAQEKELITLREEAAARTKADEDRAFKDKQAALELEAKERAAVEKTRYEAEAKERADRELADAKETHKAQLLASKAREEAAAQAERDRINAEQQALADAEADRAANKAHRRKIRTEAINALEKKKPESMNEIVDAIISGEIPHIKVTF
jgi:hypothetical protein